MLWYRRQHLSKMDRVLFTEPKPAQGWQESFVMVQDSITINMSNRYDAMAEKGI